MFSITATGTREGVIKQVKASKPNEPAKEDAQLELVKGFIEAEVNALPTEFNGCRVDASGDSSARSRTVQVSIVPLKLAV
jgi:hypothetical protein